MKEKLIQLAFNNCEQNRVLAAQLCDALDVYIFKGVKNEDGCGYGNGSCYGRGNGNGYGDGYGDGNGDGYGNTCGYGNAYGNGYGGGKGKFDSNRKGNF